MVASWDDEAKVWVAISDDIPGLVAEASTLQGLVGDLQVLIPELCELNSRLINMPANRISISADYQRFKEELRVN